MSWRPRRSCLGCGHVGRWGDSRCPECRASSNAKRESNPARRARKAARYDREHRRLRRQWAPYVAAGGIRCARAASGQCLHADPIIGPGESWDLDHLPHGSHPSHADCNRAARRNPSKETA